MLKAEPDSIAKLLQALWSACGSLAFTPKSWNEGTLFPLYKKGDPSLPANYRPICLLSAVRKVIERTIANAVQTVFIPSSMQLGFQRKLGTEMEIVQTIATIKRGNTWAAVLDLKAAYDSVPRDKLIHMCAKNLPSNMVAMITHLVQPLTVKTSCDPLQTIGITRGVTQGGPCSPVLFNIYIDELARRLHSNFLNPGGLSPARFYADDVIVHVASMCDLQAALQLCSTWAQEFGMAWALKKGKRQVLLSPDRAWRYPSFAFAGGKIDTLTKARYLGVTISTTEVLEESAIKRIQNAHMTWTQLKEANVVYCGMDGKYALMVFRSLLQSGIDYACFLSPWGQKATEAYNSLMLRFFGNVLGMRVRVSQLPRLLAIFDRDSIGHRRRAMATRFCIRMKEQCGDESDGEQRARMQAMNTLRDLTLSIHAGG